MIDHERLSTILLIVTAVMAAVSWGVRGYLDYRESQKNELDETEGRSVKNC